MGGKGTAAKLHHYVPQGYLRGFSAEKDRVAVRPLNTAKQAYVSSVRNVAAENHFHTVPGLEEPDEFERVVGNLEGNAIGILRRLVDGGVPLSEDDRWVFSYYIALQAVRGPDTRRTVEQLRAQMIRVEIGAGGRENVKRWIKRNTGAEITDDEADRVWNEATQKGGPPIRLSNFIHISHMVQAAEDIMKYVATRPWTIVDFKSRSLITSDAPVSLVRSPESEEWEGVGFGTARGILFPLARKCGLLMSDPMVLFKEVGVEDPFVPKVRAAVLRGDADGRRVGTTALEKLFNEHTADNASNYLYYHPEDGRFVPELLHGPRPVNMDMSGLADMEFDGEPWFGGARVRQNRE